MSQADYIDHEDDTILYYPTKAAAEAARNQAFPDWDEKYLRSKYDGSRRLQREYDTFEQYQRIANAKPAIRESKRRPGQWYFCCPK